ncbi:ComF family protein [Hazenella coriacea]|uniref:ComF family protein n=1 Tax=Hazenella coriacea TaxID=1179467 RepID=A0A4R3L972_9BACL|nr:ComF family protein [Hazenella coriacea]TCS95645.1 ComF family protein [Hazenella coriacea]
MREWWSMLFPPPPTCWGCQSTRSKSAKRKLCEPCQDLIREIQNPICQVCGRAFKDSAMELCLDCMRVLEEERIVNRSAVQYTDGVKQLFQLFKYRGLESLSVPIGEWMADVMIRHFSNLPIAMITYVPLHRDRLRERGFNQAELLAHVIAKKTDIFASHLLVRTLPTASQSRRGRSERLRSLKQAFALNESVDPLLFQKKSLILVDDVYTTGTTIRECAKVLKQAGAEQVYSITFAR